jgi:uncharacterized membrane protein
MPWLNELLFLLRYIHFLAGITWIGMLYYFNFVQTPFFATELGGTARGAMMRGLAPSALWWFRWGAMFTFLSGWLYLLTNWGHGGYSNQALTLILTGGVLGTLMWFNVWFVIWPAQQVMIASAERVAGGGQADPAAAQRAPIAGRASRTNTLLSLPMLFFMGSASHAQFLLSPDPNYAPYWAIVLAVVLLAEFNIFYGSAATQKPLATVSGTIHSGLGVTVVLGALAWIFI